ncbi:preprotein translocase subunit YajC [Nocardioides seonyuensis]|uniref:Preprotein translocase subunit YajC n=1 Tax=Nocardioides seonyuensis TaxID=2518371 RepID=A0A4V1BMQ8_9ACTN|nr:preprotein translocase subunit YajC [Nocardioides seonyuensis]QBX57222.1 preprotein translocase subunit YajC [Nocardioides seonyuensis]
MGDLAAFLPLLAIAVLFWLIVIRPASRRQKETLRMQADLQVGQRVMLASGIFGTIVSLTDDRATLSIASGVEVEVVRAAISGVEAELSEESSADHHGGRPDDPA